MKKYEYKVIRLKFPLIGKGQAGDYPKILNEQGIDGWRLHSIFSPVFSQGANYLELIFEKEIN